MSPLMRNVDFKFRVSPEERDALAAHAQARGMKAADVLRQYIRGLPEFSEGAPRGKPSKKKEKP